MPSTRGAYGPGARTRPAGGARRYPRGADYYDPEAPTPLGPEVMVAAFLAEVGDVDAALAVADGLSDPDAKAAVLQVTARAVLASVGPRSERRALAAPAACRAGRPPLCPTPARAARRTDRRAGR